MRRIAVLAVVFGAMLYGVHRLAMVAVARLIGNESMIVGLDCCLDYHRNTPDPWGNVLVAVSGVLATQVVAWVAIGLLGARRGSARVLATLAGTAFAVSPLLQLIVYAVWHWAERDYVAVIDYLMDATGLPEMALMAAMLGLFAGYALIFWLALRGAWDRAAITPVPAPGRGSSGVEDVA
ncbi:hypothetical protein [Nonomuraea rubra]|uniref:ABC-type amino acid transport system permease subunit n=1 Tax=Nonomuraea rubra TaxID=46180 RepID=A0A7X0TXS4_9ACTN|nr:hypothetical protein [Nonomuraea rubra]MBB6547741.1 ABC-type amino acid transport system permease subunit [Nonomuraea rubra]